MDGRCHGDNLRIMGTFGLFINIIDCLRLFVVVYKPVVFMVCS